MDVKRPHKALSFDRKLKIIEEVDKKVLSKTEISKKFDVPKSTLSRIMKDRAKIEDSVKMGTFTTNRMRMRTTPYEELENVLFVWFKRARSANFPVSGPILAEKAREIATRMGIENFNISDGWLSRFKRRHGLVFKAVSGEAAAVNRDVCSTWQQGRLQEILNAYDPRDVFNVDEMGLFYKALPSKTLTYKGEACTGGKRSKERITVLVGANVDGSEKLKLLVVAKSKKPQCFNGIRELPVTYHGNGKAWMTQAIFEGWLREQDIRFTQQGRKVVMIIDNCPAHGHVDGLKSITLEFLPANATAVVQPMDQGVIQNLKVHYRRHLMHRLLLCADSNGKEYSVDLLAALHILTHAWAQVKESTIEGCFRHAGFVRHTAACDDDGQPLADEDSEDSTDDAFAVFSQVAPSAPFSLQDYETVGENVVTCREESLDELIAEVQGEEQCSSDEDMGCDDPLPIAVSDREARDAVALLQRYFEHNGHTEFLASVTAMHTYFVKKQLQNAKQTEINSFFPVVNKSSE